MRLFDVGRALSVGRRAGGVHSLAVLADGRLACGTTSGHVVLWDAGTGTCVGTMAIEGIPAALAALPDGRLVSGSSEGVMQLWDTRPAAAAAVASSRCVASTTPMAVLAHVPHGAAALVPLPDGRLACACELTHNIYLLEVPPPATYE